MKITIDFSEWEDPFTVGVGADVLESVIESIRVLQEHHVWPVSQEDTDPVDWLEDLLYLARQVEKAQKEYTEETSRKKKACKKKVIKRR